MYLFIFNRNRVSISTNYFKTLPHVFLFQKNLHSYFRISIGCWLRVSPTKNIKDFGYFGFFSKKFPIIPFLKRLKKFHPDYCKIFFSKIAPGYFLSIPSGKCSSLIVHLIKRFSGNFFKNFSNKVMVRHF